MENISLKEFVKTVLLELSDGVKEANSAIGFKTFIIQESMGDSHKNHQGITFDIALSAARDTNNSSGFGIAIVSIGAGAKTEKTVEASSVHRIRFEVCTRHIIE